MAQKNIGPRDLGIKLHDGSGNDHFKWLLACQLFGARISQDIAAKTYKLLDEQGYTSPDKLASANWQELVDILGEGGYRHYDESTARELIAMGKLVKQKYAGSFQKVLDDADNKRAVKKSVQEFKGIGPKAADIFAREAKI
ncbi:MAG TPA: hypothetical protein VHB72_01670 [Candidatus Saccharimonadales bacterium]|nr:hypothetical protein [Candidatus Saccharimonadales bacterium]